MRDRPQTEFNRRTDAMILSMVVARSIGQEFTDQDWREWWNYRRAGLVFYLPFSLFDAEKCIA